MIDRMSVANMLLNFQLALSTSKTNVRMDLLYTYMGEEEKKEKRLAHNVVLCSCSCCDGLVEWYFSFRVEFMFMPNS